MLKIGIACDHAGYQTKEYIKAELSKLGILIIDFGTNSDKSVDYPDFAHPLGLALNNNELSFGISLCGSGNGINMVTNKYPLVRAALCWNVEIAKLARQHNDANVCSIPARFVTNEEALEIVNNFLNEKFEGGRHQRRIEKIPIK